MSIVDLQKDLDNLLADAQQQISLAESSKVLNDIKVAFTGKKSQLQAIQKEMRSLAPDEKPQLGQALKQFNAAFNQSMETAQSQVAAKELQAQLEAERLDVTLPGHSHKFGSRHILTQTREQVEDIFLGMGYQVVEGPEVEQDLYNFEKMNLPKDHPARDMQDTFYITEELLMRTHTSPVQARTMEKHDFSKGPLKMISPGKVFRRDSDDATHSHQFQQIEGLVVDKHVTMADLKGTLLLFAQQMFGEDRQIRLRPSYFPFTEPSVEIDISCFKCKGQGCNVCKHTGWIEVLGAGMVHPNVLEMSGVDSSVYKGFAFGLGIERIAMLRNNVDDIRHFYTNDLRFNQQFKGGQN